MTIAFIAWPPENDTYMWADSKRTGVPPTGVLCPDCGQRIDYQAVNPQYVLPRRYYDLSRTYDGDVLVSDRLRDFLSNLRITGIRFCGIHKSKRYSILRCSNILKLLPPATFRQEEYCNTCHQFRSVYGITESNIRFEGIDRPVEEGLYKSDVRFGYYPQMGPLLVVGTHTWQQLVCSNFKGLKNGRPIKL